MTTYQTTVEEKLEYMIEGGKERYHGEEGIDVG